MRVENTINEYELIYHLCTTMSISYISLVSRGKKTLLCRIIHSKTLPRCELPQREKY
jgi:hypothetical protein